jgi:murein DD-endopeptidase MepM/ murein hydrolase activator NlpD
MAKTIRLVMLFSLVYFFPLPGYSPRLLGEGPRKNTHAPKLLDAENGMGMAYAETAALALPESADLFPDAETGLPEPEAYSKPQMLLSFSYEVQPGDMIGILAENFGLNQDTLLSLNGIKNSRLIMPGQKLRIPNQDGILYAVKQGDTLASIAEKYGADPEAILTANELFSEAINASASLFIPGARLSQSDLQEINGDLFLWPVRGWVTSLYGYRPSPFTGVRQFHSGLDIGVAYGTPIKAAMAGRVSAVGYDDATGNYVVITHSSGYRTLYGHMSKFRTQTGAYVHAGDIIGEVGSTGQSTGPHVHFTVYKNGRTVNPRALMGSR